MKQQSKRKKPEPDGFSAVQIIEPSKMSLQTSFGGGHEQVTQFASHWHERCLKDFEFENAINKMNPSQRRIPIVEFGEVKFERAVLRPKTNLKPPARLLTNNPPVNG